ncbi:MAG: hypothetical protein ACK4XJ_06205 [Fimbriimonadaceae bacterium]
MLTKILGAAALAVAVAVPAVAGSVDSGLKVGEMVTPFHPKHVSGPDKGTDTCPPCKYGDRPQIQVWVNGDSLDNVKKIAGDLNKQVQANKAADLKAFVIFVVEPSKMADMQKKIADVATQTGYNDIAMAVLPSDNPAVKAYKMNLDATVKNTVFVYRNKKVEAKFVNLVADAKGIEALNASVKKVAAN